MRYGEQRLSYDRDHNGWYYFEPGTGAMAHGVRWMTSNGGKWVYYDINTGQMRYGEQRLSYDRDHNGWYYFAPGTGAMAHGWTSLPDRRKVFYDRNSGQMVYGWQTIDGKRYYFNKATGNLEKSENPSVASKVWWVVTSTSHVYHTKKNCPSLRAANQRNVREGTLEQAQRAGYSRLCKNCEHL
ncbi:hypothetical protein GFD21_03445 [Bifidobacterium sp. SMA15]|uniref:Cell wall-binding protein n=1 Tax=Bifidobacterium platyrrhinorum TaxID=2661628 RepID=A0A6L9SQT2_9BIFI|nr:hypothetical protein [Bifidobacterium platyrrhinorum]